MHAITRTELPDPLFDAAADAVESDEDGQSAALHVQRAIFELRSGRDVEIRAGDDRLVIRALELVEPDVLDRLAMGGVGLVLLLTPERASVLGHAGSAGAVVARLPAFVPPASIAGPGGHAAWRIAGLVDPGAEVEDGVAMSDLPGAAAAAALELVRQARLQPALLLERMPVSSRDAHIPRVDADEIGRYPAARGRLITRTGSARVQLERTSDATFVSYRERFGDAEHAAIIIGSPDIAAPVTVRLHSSCFTGDLFGSLRCDCGEQLAGAVVRLAENGGGVILYLAQEGRGIGLGNKLRAYRMQAAGLDTIEADRRLGFGADGRDFSAARAMLADLGIDRIRLLTNNPAKVAALHRDGLDVVERLPLSGSINPHNHHYLETKRDRGGHLPSVAAGNHRDALHDGPIVS